MQTFLFAFRKLFKEHIYINMYIYIIISYFKAVFEMYRKGDFKFILMIFFNTWIKTNDEIGKVLCLQ